MDLQVPLLAAKALLLLLLFAFVYAVVRRGVGDLRSIDEDELYHPRAGRDGYGAYGGASSGVPELVVEDSEVMAPDTRFSLANGTTSMGRSAASDIVLKSDDYASGRHATLSRHGGRLYIEDAGSTNGTFVNGRRVVGATPLRSGDTFRVGSTTFRYME